MFLLYRFRRGRAALCAVLCAALLLLCSLPRTARDAAPAWQAFSGPVCRADTNGELLVALTFETLGEGDTARLLEVLADHGAKATFFVEGRWAARHSEEVRAIAAAGHELGNHSQTHPRGLSGSGAQELRRELSACSETLEALTGLSPAVFRPPYGLWSEALLAESRALGMETVLWDIDSLDWRNDAPGVIARRAAQEAGPGSILRFQNGALNTATALGGALDALEARGFRFVTVSELLAAR